MVRTEKLTSFVPGTTTIARAMKSLRYFLNESVQEGFVQKRCLVNTESDHSKASYKI
jgi:hypothetical protein